MKVFDYAWKSYQKVPIYDRMNPGKDQNCVLDAMRKARAFNGLKYAYLHNLSAVLVDKMHFANRTIELGGMAAVELMSSGPTGAFAGHTTCYEHYTKVMGLKAVNAFWNPLYYDPNRRTITKQLIYTDALALLDEVRSLIWLAIATNRSLILPNILGPDAMYNSIGGYKKKTLWPGFRVLKIKTELNLLTSVLEPSFYWRVDRDYGLPPEPKIIYFDPKVHTIEDVRRLLLAADHRYSRIVLQVATLPKFMTEHATRNIKDVAADKSKDIQVLSNSKKTELRNLMKEIEESTLRWAKDSVGVFSGYYFQEITKYYPLMSVKQIRRLSNSAYASHVNEVSITVLSSSTKILFRNPPPPLPPTTTHPFCITFY